MDTRRDWQSTADRGGQFISFADPLPSTVPAGSSPSWRQLLLTVERVARHLRVATIEGEPGSGKETLARYLHQRSPLSRAAFQMSDAQQWVVANPHSERLDGLIYLNHVDRLTPPVQGMLLNVLDRLQRQDAPRVILVLSAQTSLMTMASHGLFDRRLATRIAEQRLTIPPLRNRRDDIVPIARALLQTICHRSQQKPVEFTALALSRMVHYPWPGNADELRTALEDAVFRVRGGLLSAEALQLKLDAALPAEELEKQEASNLLLNIMIRRHVRFVLDLNRWNKRRAAHQLGISRSTLYRFIGDMESAL